MSTKYFSGEDKETLSQLLYDLEMRYTSQYGSDGVTTPAHILFTVWIKAFFTLVKVYLFSSFGEEGLLSPFPLAPCTREQLIYTGENEAIKFKPQEALAKVITKAYADKIFCPSKAKKIHVSRTEASSQRSYRI